MNFFTRLVYLFTAPREVEELILDKRAEFKRQDYENQRHRLNLCYKHRQEQNHSHYSEHNCHHCQLQNHSAWQHSELLRKDSLLRGAPE